MMKSVLIAAAVAGMDQMIKCFVRHYPYGHEFCIVPGMIRITHCMNTGAAFSIFSGQTLLLIGASLLLMIGIALFVSRTMCLTPAAEIACACLLGGGIGNLIDRICFGGVTDYIELLLFHFPVFNLADIAITGSIAALLFMSFAGMLENTTGECHGSNH